VLDYGCGSGSFTLADRGLSDLKPGDMVNVSITDQVITTFAKLG
jgi:hypothetical protein